MDKTIELKLDLTGFNQAITQATNKVRDVQRVTGKKVNLNIKTDLASRALTGIKTQLRSLSSFASSTLKNLAIGGFTAGLAAVSVGIKSGINDLDLLSKTANQTGVDIADLYRVYAAGVTSDLSIGDIKGIAESLGTAMYKATTRGAKGAEIFKKAFKDVGVSTKQLENMSLPEKLKTILDALQKVKDPETRQFLAEKLLGGTNALNLMGVDFNKAQFNPPKNLSKIAGDAEKLNDAFSEMYRNFKEILAIGFLKNFKVDKLSETFKGLNPFFEKLGDAIGQLVKYVMENPDQVIATLKGLLGALVLFAAIGKIGPAISGISTGFKVIFSAVDEIFVIFGKRIQLIKNIFTNIKGFKDLLKNLFTGKGFETAETREGWKDGLSAKKNWLNNNIFKANKLSSFKSLLKGNIIFTTIIEGISFIYKAFTGGLKDFWDDLVKTILKIWAITLASSAGALWGAGLGTTVGGSLFGPVGAVVFSIIGGILGAILGALGADWLMAKIDGVVQSITDFFQWVAEKIFGAIFWFGDQITAAYDWIQRNLPDWAPGNQKDARDNKSDQNLVGQGKKLREERLARERKAEEQRQQQISIQQKTLQAIQNFGGKRAQTTF